MAMRLARLMQGVQGFQIGYNKRESHIYLMHGKLFVLLPGIVLALLAGLNASTEAGSFPDKCVIASKPTKCRVNSFGVMKNPNNSFEIYHPEGTVGIRFGKEGVKEGAVVIVDNMPGSIQSLHGGDFSTAVTIVTKQGMIYSFTYGD